MTHPLADLVTLRRALDAREPERLEGDKRAAVAAVLRQVGEDEPEILLIRRAEHPEDPWSGHMAFPGGRHDPTDRDLLHTAVRETDEELGLALDRHARLLGRLEDIPAVARGRRTGLIISPFVFELVGEPDLVPNHEVAEALWAPLGPMLRGEIATVRPYEHEGQRYEMPAFDVEGRVVWGLTYHMLGRLLDLLR
jgi:8-oxo-dGTP pyrophosphatase MutT (NUDIX family)